MRWDCDEVRSKKSVIVKRRRKGEQKIGRGKIYSYVYLFSVRVRAALRQRICNSVLSPRSVVLLRQKIKGVLCGPIRISTAIIAYADC